MKENSLLFVVCHLFSVICIFLTPDTCYLDSKLKHIFQIRDDTIHDISGCSFDKIIADVTG